MPERTKKDARSASPGRPRDDIVLRCRAETLIRLVRRDAFGGIRVNGQGIRAHDTEKRDRTRNVAPLPKTSKKAMPEF